MISNETRTGVGAQDSHERQASFPIFKDSAAGRQGAKAPADERAMSVNKRPSVNNAFFG
jgi:hypothetical protein